MRRHGTAYPRHAFPHVAVGTTAPSETKNLFLPQLTPFERHILGLLNRGAKILFDIEEKRAMIYRWGCGVESLAAVTVRTLSRLMRRGLIAWMGREGRWVHYGRYQSLPCHASSVAL